MAELQGSIKPTTIPAEGIVYVQRRDVGRQLSNNPSSAARA
jgi:hypothetical protein